MNEETGVKQVIDSLSANRNASSHKEYLVPFIINSKKIRICAEEKIHND